MSLMLIVVVVVVVVGGLLMRMVVGGTVRSIPVKGLNGVGEGAVFDIGLVVML